MRRSSVITTIATTTTLVAFAAGDAEARLDLYVDKSVQQMSVIQNGRLLYVWPLSTGRDKFSAPSGVYTPERLERSWFSRAYYNSPMPHAIFFHGGYIIHGSDDISKVGGPASRGCIRLHPDDAALLFSMVKLEGPDNTVIFIDGDSGRPPRPYGSFDDPALRRADAMARNPYPPPRGADPYVDGGGAYPPPDPPMPPYAGRHVDGRGAYPPGPDAAPYGDQYGDGRSAPRGPGALPDYTVDPYGDRHGVPHGAGTPRDYDGDRYADRRAGPRAPGMPPDYAVDPYGDGRGARRGPAGPPDDRERYADRRSGPPDPRLPPDYPADPYGRGGRYGPAAAPYPLADHHGGGPGADPRDPRMPYPSGSEVDAAGQSRSGQWATPGNNLPGRVLTPRPQGAAQADRAQRNALPPPTAGVKSKRGHVADQPPKGQGAGGPDVHGPGGSAVPAPHAGSQGPRAQGPGWRGAGLPVPGAQGPGVVPAPWPATASLPPPAAPASGPPASGEGTPAPPPDIGYTVLPKSYWSGASWRWRPQSGDRP